MAKFHPNKPRPSLRAGELVAPIGPIVGDCSWFYDEDAGGFEMPFGKYSGKKIHEISFGYIAWFQDEFKGKRRCEPLLDAASKYKNGLEGYMEGHYGEFLVPLGKVYRGTQICRVRNKPWMRWLQGWIQRRGLGREYGLFLCALQLWLDNPHHQGVKRDIGERTDQDADDHNADDEDYLEMLPESEWADDVGYEDPADDLYAQEKDIWEQEDLDFIDDADACSMIMDGSASYVSSGRMSVDGIASDDSSSAQLTSDENDEQEKSGEDEGDGDEEMNGSDCEDGDSQDESMQESNNEEEDLPPARNKTRKTTSRYNGGAESTKDTANSELAENSTSDMEDDEPLDVIKERILSTPKKDRRRYPQRRYIQSPSPAMSDENQGPQSFRQSDQR